MLALGPAGFAVDHRDRQDVVHGLLRPARLLHPFDEKPGGLRGDVVDWLTD